jgi:hypothetical protein
MTTWSGHANEPHGAAMGGRLNWLQAGVLWANDGDAGRVVVGHVENDRYAEAVAAASVPRQVAAAVLGDTCGQ